MDMITVTAKTLDEAITQALIELGTTSDNLEYTVVEKGSSGFFGLFGKDVVIQAKKKKEDDIDELFASITEELEESEDLIKNEPKAKKDNQKDQQYQQKEKKEQKKDKKQHDNKQKAEDNAQPSVKADKTVKPEKSEKSEKTEKTDKAVKPEKTEKTEKAPKPEKTERSERPEKAEKTEKPVKIDYEQCEITAKEFLSEVFDAMGMEVALKTSYDEQERELTIEMSGDNMGVLIGKRGQTLDALQYLVSLVVNKKTEGYLRVKLDTENYRERRKETLETLAKNIAYKVKRTRRSVSLEPMNPYERRIIHSALQGDKYVVTRSEGEDPYRHVVISLKHDGKENRDNKANK